jgi:hypothetical protein
VTLEGRVQETKLAWALAEAVKPHLSAVERDRVFVSIGAGETFAVIRHLFDLIAAERIPLCGDLVQQCRTWLHAYAGHQDMRNLHRYLGSLHVHPTRYSPSS